MKNILSDILSLLVDTLTTLGFFVAFMAALVAPLWVSTVFPGVPSWGLWVIVVSMGPILALVVPE